MDIEIAQLLKLLADDSRLRLLSLLDEEELSVQELVAITGMGQSKVSRHLGPLRQWGMVKDRREGTWTFYSTSKTNGEALPSELWKLVGSEFRNSDAARDDLRELERVRESRREGSRSVHDRLAGVWRMVGEKLEHGSLRAEVLGALAAQELVVADLGCGAGFITGYLGQRVGRVIGIDHSEAMLREARKALGEESDVDVEFRRGELDALPLEDEEVDAVVANLVFHHVPDFAAGAREVARVLRPGGVAVITDLQPHAEEWMREEMGDPRLGIEVEELERAFREAPFSKVEVLPVDDRYRLKSPGGRVARLELLMLRARK